MIKKITILLVLIMLPLLVSTAVLADDPGFPWRNHAAPFGFKFGNLIDSHQQSKIVGKGMAVSKNKLPKLERQGMLQGFIYIQFTGEQRDGIPVAVRADCQNENLDCRVGWKIKGIPFNATLVSTAPREWEVEKSLLPNDSTYVHFHWTGIPKKPCGLEIGQTYSGYLLQRTAVTEFFWLGGNSEKSHGGHVVSPGMDLHSNIVTDYDPDAGGGCGDHEDGEDDGCGGHEDGEDEGGCGGHEDGEDEGGCGGHEDGEDEGGCGGHEGDPAVLPAAIAPTIGEGKTVRPGA